MKRIIALILAVVMVLGLTACGNSAEEAAKADINKNLDAISGKLDDVIAALENSNTASGSSDENVQTGDVSTEDVSEETSEETSGEASTQAGSSDKTTKPVNTDYTKTDPSKWTTAQVIDYYKKAAAATDKAGCKSKQTMSLQSLDGGEGFVGSILSSLEGAGKKALAKNSTTYDGLTGGYQKLSVSDVKSATATKSGNYIIVNIVPKDQTDGIKGNSKEGTVGHLVSVLDSVATAIEEMGLPADIPEGSATLLYNNAYAKDIKINASTLVIESGKWGHTVNASINGMKILGVTLKGAKAVILYSVELTK